MNANQFSILAEARSAPFQKPSHFPRAFTVEEQRHQGEATPEDFDLLRQCFLSALSSVTGGASRTVSVFSTLKFVITRSVTKVAIDRTSAVS